jgi:hypothetical protein
MLKNQIESKREEYDFKYIKRKFKQPQNDKVYFGQDEVDKMI